MRTNLQNEPLLVGDEIPKVCTVADVCRILRMSESQFYALRRKKEFPLAPLPAFDRMLRFRGSDVQAYLDGEIARTRKRPA